MMDWNGHMTGGGWFLSILAILIIVALIGTAIVWITRELGPTRDPRPATATPAREILDRRLASGEINAEQHDQLRQALEAPPGEVHARS